MQDTHLPLGFGVLEPDAQVVRGVRHQMVESEGADDGSEALLEADALELLAVEHAALDGVQLNDHLQHGPGGAADTVPNVCAPPGHTLGDPRGE